MAQLGSDSYQNISAYWFVMKVVTHRVMFVQYLII